jgi:glycine cleavage system H protein
MFFVRHGKNGNNMPMETKYTNDEEWVSIDGDTATVGITIYAQEQLGDLVFVQLPAAGQRLTKGKEAATVESVKAVSDICSPISGEVLEINPAIVAEPGLVNSDPMGAGWFFKVRIEQTVELADLMDEAQYRDYAKK